MVAGRIGQSANDTADVIAADDSSITANNRGQGEQGIGGGAHNAARIPISIDTGKADGFSENRQACTGFHQTDKTAHGIAGAGNGGDGVNAGQGELGILAHNGAEVAAAKNGQTGKVSQVHRHIGAVFQIGDQGNEIAFGGCIRLGQGDCPAVAALTMGHGFGKESTLPSALNMGFQRQPGDFGIVREHVEQRAVQRNGAGLVGEKDFTPEGIFLAAQALELQRIRFCQKVKACVLLITGAECQIQIAVFLRINIGKHQQLPSGGDLQGVSLRLKLGHGIGGLPGGGGGFLSRISGLFGRCSAFLGGGGGFLRGHGGYLGGFQSRFRVPFRSGGKCHTI